MTIKRIMQVLPTYAILTNDEESIVEENIGELYDSVMFDNNKYEICDIFANNLRAYWKLSKEDIDYDNDLLEDIVSYSVFGYTVRILLNVNINKLLFFYGINGKYIPLDEYSDMCTLTVEIISDKEDETKNVEIDFEKPDNDSELAKTDTYTNNIELCKELCYMIGKDYNLSAIIDLTLEMCHCCYMIDLINGNNEEYEDFTMFNLLDRNEYYGYIDDDTDDSLNCISDNQYYSDTNISESEDNQ